MPINNKFNYLDVAEAKYTGAPHDYVLITEKHQLLNKKTWDKFVWVFTEDSDDHDIGWRCEYWDQAEFGAHCAIDGFKTNSSHGTYPNQSWGPNATVKSTDVFTIDFGREVVVNDLVIYLRGDFVTSGNSHDAYFSEITVKLSDGTEFKFNPTKTRKAQTFNLEGKTTTSVTITGFVTDNTNSQGWTGFAEVEVNGYDIVG